MARSVAARPGGTAWGSVLGGWLATLGVAALLSPLVTAVVAGLSLDERSLAAAVPVIVGVGLAFLLNYLDDRINSSEDAELLGFRVLGSIPHGKLTASSTPEAPVRITAVGT